MKKITKICVLMATFIAAIGLTGCPHAADFFQSFGKDDLYGTWMTLEFDENGNRQDYYLTAFGDSRGDKEMLAWADESYFKPFRQ